jgi:catechol 2,3-dioxygenase-like lactoylglutathione lyase family enzyme
MVKLDHLTIAVSDWRASRDWYVRGFGFAVEFEVGDGGTEHLGVAALQDDAGLTVFLEQRTPPILSGQGAYALQVDDVAAVHSRLARDGARVIAPPGPQFWGYGAVVADPDGHMLHLWDEASMAAHQG